MSYVVLRRHTRYCLSYVSSYVCLVLTVLIRSPRMQSAIATRSNDWFWVATPPPICYYLSAIDVSSSSPLTAFSSLSLPHHLSYIASAHLSILSSLTRLRRPSVSLLLPPRTPPARRHSSRALHSSLPRHCPQTGRTFLFLFLSLVRSKAARGAGDSGERKRKRNRERGGGRRREGERRGDASGRRGPALCCHR